MQNLSNKQSEELCRCGYDKNSKDPHPCHWGGYTCGKPSSIRFILNNAGMTGSTVKFGANDTWACDEHWQEYQQLTKCKK